MHLKNNNTSSNWYNKFIYSARAMSLSKNKQWIENMVMAGNICVQDGHWKDDYVMDYLHQMNQIIDALDVAYKDNWDMHIVPHSPGSSDNSEKSVVFSLHPIIRYPHLTVTNSRDESTEIKDLIVRIPLKMNTSFDSFNFTVKTIQGTRMHYSYDHFKYGYVHSHLNSMNPANGDLSLNEFCIGSDTEIGEIMLEMEGNGFDEGLFGLYLTIIDTIVAWESIEGTPYHYMRKVTDNDQEKEVSLGRSDIRMYYEDYFRPNITELDANFVYNKGRYQIKIDDKLNNFVRNFIMTYNDGHLVNKLMVKQKDGRYYSPREINHSTPEQLLRRAKQSDGELPYTFIQGQKVYLRVAPKRVGEPVDLNEYNVYPKFLENVTQQLEKELYDKAVRSSAIARQTELVDA